MPKQIQRFLENQAKVRVIARAKKDDNQLKFAALATFFAGIFYFFGNSLWSALSGG